MYLNSARQSCFSAQPHWYTSPEHALLKNTPQVIEKAPPMHNPNSQRVYVEGRSTEDPLKGQLRMRRQIKAQKSEQKCCRSFGTTSVALVTSSDALVPSSFLLPLVRHLLLVAMHLLLVAMHLFLIAFLLLLVRHLLLEVWHLLLVANCRSFGTSQAVKYGLLYDEFRPKIGLILVPKITADKNSAAAMLRYIFSKTM